MDLKNQTDCRIAIMSYISTFPLMHIVSTYTALFFYFLIPLSQRMELKNSNNGTDQSKIQLKCSNNQSPCPAGQLR